MNSIPSYNPETNQMNTYLYQGAGQQLEEALAMDFEEVIERVITANEFPLSTQVVVMRTQCDVVDWGREKEGVPREIEGFRIVVAPRGKRPLREATLRSRADIIDGAFAAYQKEVNRQKREKLPNPDVERLRGATFSPLSAA